MKDNWGPWLELGYSEDYLGEQEEIWARDVLELLTDEYAVEHICENVKTIFEYYDRDEAFLLAVRYTSSFMVGNDTFISRLCEIHKQLGDDWDQIIWERFTNDEPNIFDAIGYLRESDWREAIGTILTDGRDK